MSVNRSGGSNSDKNSTEMLWLNVTTRSRCSLSTSTSTSKISIQDYLGSDIRDDTGEIVFELGLDKEKCRDVHVDNAKREHTFIEDALVCLGRIYEEIIDVAGMANAQQHDVAWLDERVKLCDKDHVACALYVSAYGGSAFSQSQEIHVDFAKIKDDIRKDGSSGILQHLARAQYLLKNIDEYKTIVKKIDDLYIKHKGGYSPCFNHALSRLRAERFKFLVCCSV